jgi:hypothetical protein
VVIPCIDLGLGQGHTTLQNPFTILSSSPAITYSSLLCSSLESRETNELCSSVYLPFRTIMIFSFLLSSPFFFSYLFSALSSAERVDVTCETPFCTPSPSFLCCVLFANLLLSFPLPLLILIITVQQRCS